MNYAANTTRWKPGDLVIHDCDAKSSEMLMRVVGYDKSSGECITVYDRDRHSHSRSKRWHNDIKFLHDPERFGIPLLEPEAAR